ncbi:MAG: putative hydro-lyase [Planctomycetota bacterium]|nr:putative hydro-lyase [Planctomycetota bacterium]
MAPEEARRLFREGRWRGPTAGIAMRHVQANLVVLPADLADAFEAYCRKNPQPCPLLERLPRGFPRTRVLAAGADLRRDLPRYRIHEGRQAAWRDVDDLTAPWEPDDVAFLLGCSFSLEQALVAAGLPVRHVEEGRNVPMYLTRRETVAVPPFGGRLVVSMRPLPADLVPRAVEATAAYRFCHGAPVHAGDPAALGIRDLARPEWGDAVTIRPGEVPVFWACGVTSQVALQDALRRGDLDRALTHAPGHMFVGDATNDELLGRGDLPLA